jgi:hypothetical protein
MNITVWATKEGWVKLFQPIFTLLRAWEDLIEKWTLFYLSGQTELK